MAEEKIILKKLDISNPNFPTEKDRMIIVSRFILYLREYWHEIGEGTGQFRDEWIDHPTVGQEHNYRPHTDSMHIIAVALSSEYYDPEIGGVSFEELKDYLEKGLRFIASSHISNPKSPFKGCSWGSHPQSTLWTSHLVKTIYLAGDKVSEETREMIRKVVVYEADRFLDVEPPSGLLFDTKAEENSWDSSLLGWASILYNDHPHAKLWEEKAKEFAINIYSVYDDRFDNTWLENRRVNEWVSTVNIHPDYTLENHGSFHTDYQRCYHFWLSLIPAYLDTNRPIPRHFLHHLPDVLDLVRQCTLWKGYIARPAGLDWFEARFIFGSGALAEMYDDDLLRKQYRRMFLNYDQHQHLSKDGSTLGSLMPKHGGRIGEPRWSRFQKETSKLVKFLTYSWLPKKIPRENFRLQQNVEGVFHHPYCELVICRTPHMFASFSWRSLWHMPCGLVISKECDDFTGWSHRGPDGVHCPYAGSLKFGGEREEAVEVLTHREQIPKGENRFSTYGITRRGVFDQNDSQKWLANQHLLFAVLPDERTVLVNDYIKCLRECEVVENLSLDYHIENDLFNGDRRMIYFQGKQADVPGVHGTPRVITTESNWLNIDDEISFVSKGSSSFNYKDNADRTDDIWRTQNYDRVYAQCREGQFCRDDVIRDETVIIVAESTHLSIHQKMPVVEKHIENGVITIDCVDTAGNEASFLLNTTMNEKTIEWKGKKRRIESYNFASID